MIWLAAVGEVRNQEVWNELGRQWPDYGVWGIDPDNDYDYGEYIRSEWRGDEPLVIVEQDVIPPPGSIMGLLGCPRDWCAHEVDLGGHLSARNLSLVKFSARLQLYVPSLAEQALPRAGSERKQISWRSVDQAMIRALEFAGFQVHVHQPPAVHLHRYLGFPPGGPAPSTPDTPA